MLKLNFLKFFIYFQIYFILIYLFINLLSVNFLLICEESNSYNIINPSAAILNHNIINSSSTLDLQEFYISSKSFEENSAKNCLTNCLAAIKIFFENGDGTEPFHYKKFLGKTAVTYFEKLYYKIVYDPRISPKMADFLSYLKNPNLQIENFEHFQFLYENFIIEYRSLYEKDWHPAGFEREFDYFKNKITIEEISPLSIKKNKQKIVEIAKALKIFQLIGAPWGSNGSTKFFITYTEYGQNFLKPLYDEFLIEPKKIKEYKSAFFFKYSESDDNYLYKLRNIIKHINKIQWFLEEYQLNFKFDDNLNSEKYNAIKSMHMELKKEKELLQELIFIIHYPKAVNGDIYLMKKLKDSQFYLSENKDSPQCANIYLPFYDLREFRSYKCYLRFLIEAGIINDRTTIERYWDYIAIFTETVLTGKNLMRNPCLKADYIIRLTESLESFLIDIRLQEEKFAINYLSMDTVLKIKTKKIYYH